MPVFILLGYWFADKIDGLMHLIDRIKHILIPVVLVGIIVFLVVYYVRRRRLAVQEGWVVVTWTRRRARLACSSSPCTHM